ncbi:MAG: hypothetical protein AAB353_02560 [Candidatus Hydrogenedentota bacterium]
MLNSFWLGLSAREKFLAVITVSLLSIGTVWGTVFKSFSSLNRLDRRIEALELELVNLEEQKSISESAEVAFRGLASEHSTLWTEAEIHDRLRREIFRLSLLKPPAPAADMQDTVLTSQDHIVQIPRLREGTLTDDGEGYREYHLGLRIPPTVPSNLVAFLERLQTSKQFLRIDALDIFRDPSGTELSASIEVTRTIVDASPEDVKQAEEYVDNFLTNPGFETYEGENVPGWTAVGCTLTREREDTTEGLNALGVVAPNGSGEIYQALTVQAGVTYGLFVDVIARSPVLVSVFDEEAGRALDGGQEVPGDGAAHRVQIDFRAPGTSGNAQIRAPYIALEGAGAEVKIDNARLVRVEA